jgi:hypothetical protein
MKWRKRVAIAGVVVLLYVLSIGPASKFSNDKNTATILDWVYAPIWFLCEFDWPARAVFWYLDLWGFNLAPPN